MVEVQVVRVLLLSKFESGTNSRRPKVAERASKLLRCDLGTSCASKGDARCDVEVVVRRSETIRSQCLAVSPSERHQGQVCWFVSAWTVLIGGLLFGSALEVSLGGDGASGRLVIQLLVLGDQCVLSCSDGTAW